GGSDDEGAAARTGEDRRTLAVGARYAFSATRRDVGERVRGRVAHVLRTADGGPAVPVRSDRPDGANTRHVEHEHDEQGDERHLHEPPSNDELACYHGDSPSSRAGASSGKARGEN